MAFVIFDDSSITVAIKHVELKPNGAFQYRRRIPLCLQSHYLGKLFFVRSLGRDTSALAHKATALSAELETIWGRFRARAEAESPSGPNSAEEEILGFDLKGGVAAPHAALKALVDHLRSAGNYGRDSSHHQPQQSVAPYRAHAIPDLDVTLQRALDIYLEHHRKGKLKQFRADPVRVISGMVALAGDLPLSLYTRQQAQQFRDHLLSRNSTGTVRRRLDTLVAVFNKAVAEEGLVVANPFENLSIPQEGQDAKKRVSYTRNELSVIAAACRRLDDDIRHIIALQLDTGARAGEIIGLRVADVALDHAFPHVHIRPYGDVRTLKTDASQRAIPLVGEAFWAAGQAVEARRKAADGSPWLFPRYASNKEIKATHASNTLNKWLRSLDGVDSGKTTHCFRHAMRDRLRAVQVPHDIQEAIGGWGTRTIGQGYGNGYPIEILAEHMGLIHFLI